MTAVFQKFVSGDLESLGSVYRDPITNKPLCKCEKFATTNQDQFITLQYASAVVFGFDTTPRPDVNCNGFGEIGYTLLDNSQTFCQMVPFVQSIQDGVAVAQLSQPVQLYIPPRAKIYFSIPLFSGMSGDPGGGARLALSGISQKH